MRERGGERGREREREREGERERGGGRERAFDTTENLPILSGPVRCCLFWPKWLSQFAPGCSNSPRPTSKCFLYDILNEYFPAFPFPFVGIAENFWTGVAFLWAKIRDKRTTTLCSGDRLRVRPGRGVHSFWTIFDCLMLILDLNCPIADALFKNLWYDLIW